MEKIGKAAGFFPTSEALHPLAELAWLKHLQASEVERNFPEIHDAIDLICLRNKIMHQLILPICINIS